MIQHVPFEAVDQRHIVGLANSLLAAPADNRPEPEEFLRAVMLGTMRLFEWDGGMALVGVRDNRLVLYAFSADSIFFSARRLAEDLKRLAADWECDTIETTCFDPRLTCVIKRLGGRVESMTITLAAE